MMKVMKFGGTSVGTAESLKKVKAIVESESDRVIIVVSALGGVTDMLLKTARQACEGEESWLETFEEIKDRHFAVVNGLISDADKNTLVTVTVESLLSELSDLYRGLFLLRDLSTRTQCQIVSYGERMSSFIISHILRDARLFYSPEFIKTEKWFGKNIVEKNISESLVKKAFLDDDSWRVAVVPGFISTDKDTGDITNLGRGGSDYTAAILAATLDADVLEIWTDVDGFMTADPRVINKASVIDELSFIESMDLCNFGAKVIYPPTIYPVFHKNIPIIIKNTFNASAPGTLITENGGDKSRLKGISSISGVSLIRISVSDTADNVSSLNSRVLTALSKNGVAVLLSAIVPEVELMTISLVVADSEMERALQVINEELVGEFASSVSNPLETVSHLSILTIVGENIKYAAEIPANIENTLHRYGINPLISSTGASEISFSVLLDSDKAVDGLRIIHENFLE